MKYEVKKYGAWWWIIIDTATKLAVRDKDNKLLLFHSKSAAQDWVKEQTKWNKKRDDIEYHLFFSCNYKWNHL